MPSTLTLDEHLTALRKSGTALRDTAAGAGLDAKVPTCPAWDVTKLVTHQGMVHRWAAANLRQDDDHQTAASVVAASAAPDLLDWYSAGLDELIVAVTAAAPDAQAMVFLKDAPPPRQFWARRQAHETTIHGVDAVAAGLGRWPGADDVSIEPALAADGIDELLTGFITRGNGKIHADEPCTLLVRADDTGQAWTVRITDGPIVTTPGSTGTPDAVFAGSAVQLYLSLWNRADEISVTGRSDLVAQWRSAVRVRWS
jgi:uncharacterized protein (TIGR03083 family)